MKFDEKNSFRRRGIEQDKAAGDAGGLVLFIIYLLHDPFYGVVEAADGEFVVGFLDGDDDVQLAGALVDHADVNVRVGDHAEDARGGAFGVDHALADDGNEGEPVFDADVVGLQLVLDPAEDLLARRGQRLGRDDDGDRIDARRAVLKRDAVVSEDLQQMGHEADLAVHHGFFHVHAAEALVPGDAGDLALVRVGRERRDDEGAGILRPVGVADVDGDIDRKSVV